MPFDTHKAHMEPHKNYLGESKNDEWYTPPNIIALIKRVMPIIDTDPAPCPHNSLIGASNNLKNGLFEEWNGNTFLNPPYSRGLYGKFIEKAIASSNQVSQLIVLTNNNTETKPTQRLMAHADMVCFLSYRIGFLKLGDDGALIPVKGNTRGQMISYFGENTDLFYNVFKDDGVILKVQK